LCVTSVIKFDPFRGFESLTRRMGSMLDEFDKGFSVQFSGFAPRVDISEDDKNLFIHAELPGMLNDDVKVTINEDNLLTIKVTKQRQDKTEDKSGDKSFIRMERSFGEFTRSFVLSENVDGNSIKAKFENGVLNLTLDKKEPVKPKEIEVSID